MRDFDWRTTPLGEPAQWPESLKTLVSILHSSNRPPMFIAWGPQRTLLYNEAYADLLTTRHPHAMGRDFLDVWFEIRDDMLPLVEKVYRGESVQMDDIELKLLRSGFLEEVHLSFFYSPVCDGEGAVMGMFCACTDITTQVKVQKQLQEREARYRGVLDHMDEAFVLLDRHFCLLEINDAALRLEPRSRESMLNCSHWNLYPGTENSELGVMYKQCMADGIPRAMEHLHVWEDGRQNLLEVRANPTPAGLALFYRDITPRRLLEQQAAESAERVQLALDAGAIIGTWVWDVDEDILKADARYANTFGLDEKACREGLALEDSMACLHPADRDRVARAIDETLKGNGSYCCEYRVRQADGSFLWVEANGHVETGPDGRRRFPGVLMNVEARHVAQAERDQANTLLQTIVTAVPGVVYAKDLQGRMLLANQGTADLIGKPVHAIVGKTDAEFLDDPVQAEAIMATDRRIMNSGHTEQIEEQFSRSDGTPTLWLSTKAPLHDADGQVIGLVGASVDISERKRMEETLRDSDRRKDEFLAMLGHELRNPLAPIRTVSALLDKKLGAQPEFKPMLQVLARQTTQLSRLVDDLLDVARLTQGHVNLKLESVECGAVIEQAIETIRALAAEKSHQLHVHRPGEKLYVWGDSARLVQALTNLLHNALKYTDPCGTITLAVTSTEHELVLSVQDTGIGISAELLPHVFDLFVQSERSLDRSQGGLGIGLSVVRRLVEMHHGTLRADSAGLGRGSTFEIRLPKIPAPHKAVEPVVPASGGAQQILVVDDNRDAADSLALLLMSEGHTADVVYRSTEVLDRLGMHHFDIVLLDIGMPEMNGFEVAHAIRARHGNALKLIALTGYGLPEDRERTAAAGFDAHLVKPVDLEMLLSCVAGRRAHGAWQAR